MEDGREEESSLITLLGSTRGKALLHELRQSHLSTVLPAVELSQHFSFLQVQPNNYSTFYDDQRQNWSIMFESEKAAMEFNKQVRLFYSFCEEPNTSLDFP